MLQQQAALTAIRAQMIRGLCDLRWIDVTWKGFFTRCALGMHGNMQVAYLAGTFCM